MVVALGGWANGRRGGLRDGDEDTRELNELVV